MARSGGKPAEKDREPVQKDPEELIQKRKRIRREEEEEDIEISEYYCRLEYMRENCPVGARDICGLIEEQQGMLNSLRTRKREFSDNWDKTGYL